MSPALWNGGVLEPVLATTTVVDDVGFPDDALHDLGAPTIIEDNCFIGARAVITLEKALAPSSTSVPKSTTVQLARSPTHAFQPARWWCRVTYRPPMAPTVSRVVIVKQVDAQPVVNWALTNG